MNKFLKNALLYMLALLFVSACANRRMFEPKTHTERWLSYDDHKQYLTFANMPVRFKPLKALLSPGAFKSVEQISPYKSDRENVTPENLKNLSGWQITEDTEKDQVRFRFDPVGYGLRGWGRVAGYNNQTIKRIWLREPTPIVFEKIFKDESLRAQEQNKWRREIYRGTFEERWQESLEQESLRIKASKHYILDVKTDKMVLLSTLPKEQQAIRAKSVFMDSLENRRRKYQGIKESTVVKTIINGKPCTQHDKYDRLLTPAKQYANETVGGIEHDRTYYCIIDIDNLVMISMMMRTGRNKSLDFDEMFKPLLDSIEWNYKVKDSQGIN